MHAQQLRKHLLPSIEWLRENLRYDPETGELWWIKPKQKRTLCKPAGYLNNQDGYYRVRVSYNILLKRSRVAFALMEGRWPNCIDHINGNSYDDRWGNLREVTQKENLRNQKIRSDNTSGVVGVCWDTSSKKWRAYIKVNGKLKHLGFYDTIEEAIAVRKAAEAQYGFHENHGRDTEIATTEPTQ